MKKRRILIIHDSKVFLNIIKRTITAEVPDVDLHMAQSANDGIDRLNKESYDMVISANEMIYMNGTEIHELMRDTGRHNKTGFLLLTSNTDRGNQLKFKKKGISNVLKYPFQAGELALQVEKLSQGREWRRHKRIMISGIRAIIEPEKAMIPLEVVNISMGGILSNLKVADGIPRFSRYYRVNILFPDSYRVPAIKTRGYTLRQDALQWLEPPEPEVLQIAWRLNPISDRDMESLEKILDKAIK